MRNLRLSLARSTFAPLIRRANRELRTAGIAMKPHFYLSTEYGCLEGTTTIGLLWTDGFGWAQKIAKHEGIRTRSRPRVLRTLRHEIGHAFCYAHQLYRTKRFRDLFGVKGSFFGSYPEIWEPRTEDIRKLERGEVILLYAARHPDEDFAVCFEHWMGYVARRSRGWKRHFHDRPRIVEKLDYVDEIVHSLGRRRPAIARAELDEDAREIRLTVAEWIEKVKNGTNYNLLPHRLPDSTVGA